MKYDFDLVIIGGGAAGLFSASIAIALGAKTCLVEKKRLGGDCTWFGCVPSKAILKSASVANLLKRSSQFGIKIPENFTLDVKDVLSHVKETIKEISNHTTPEVFEKRGIKVIFGKAQFLDSHTLEIEGKKISSAKFIICTGSRPAPPPIEGLAEMGYLTNEDIFYLKELPQSLIILGGGPIGVELAQSLNRLGVKIYLVEMLERILFREDKEVAAILEQKLKQEGVKVLICRKAIGVVKKDNLLSVTMEYTDGSQSEILAENILVAVGRIPNVEGLALEKAAVESTKKGVTVNSYLQTTNKNIFACGDVVGPYQFSHIAAYQAAICVRNALFRRLAWQKVNYQNVPWSTFTEPELAHLGLTEEEARAIYPDLKIYKMEYTGSDRAITDLEKEGLIKVITDRKGFILGAHIVGAQASEIIQGLLIAKSLKLPLSKISQITFIYPTLSELVKKTAAKSLIEKMNNPLIKFILKILR